MRPPVPQAERDRQPMNMSAFDRFRAAVLARDPDAAVAEMAEDVRFYNPASPEPTIGRS